MCRQCARGGCAFYFRNRGAPTNRALASACSPAPTTPTILKVHPPTPLKWGLSCSLLPFAALQKLCVSQQNGAEMDYCRVVGPRGLCRPLDEKQGFPTNTSPLAPCQGCSKAEQSRTTFREEAGGPLPRRTWGPSLGKRVTSGLVYREALPSLTVLTRRSAGGLGRSFERPCKWSAALSAV